MLATYDRRHSLPRAIASALAQDDVRFELIVVDGASRDGTSDYLATLCDPCIRAIKGDIAWSAEKPQCKGHNQRVPGRSSSCVATNR